MIQFHRWLAWVRVATVALFAWSLTAAIALAETRPGAADADSGKSYVIPYMLVILVTALGLLIVCRSANRTNEPRRTDDDD